VRFKANLSDGAVLRGELPLPAMTISSGPGRPRPEAVGKAIAESLIPQLAVQFAPYLPPAAPARKVVQRGEDNRILGTREYPATPAPAYLARQIAERLVPSVAAEYAHAIRARYAAIDAADREAKAAQSAKPVGPPAKAQPAVSPQAQAAAQAALGAMTQAVGRAKDVAARLNRLERTPPPPEVPR
jgi:hypothetical protein